MLSKIGLSQKYQCYAILLTQVVVKLIKTLTRIVTARYSEEGNFGCYLMDMEFEFYKVKTF